LLVVRCLVKDGGNSSRNWHGLSLQQEASMHGSGPAKAQV
jgi:hypothetical protein